MSLSESESESERSSASSADLLTGMYIMEEVGWGGLGRWEWLGGLGGWEGKGRGEGRDLQSWVEGS